MAYKYLDTTGLTALWAKIKSAIPKKTSELINDEGYLTAEEVASIVEESVGSTITMLPPLGGNIDTEDTDLHCRLIKDKATNTVRLYFNLNVIDQSIPIPNNSAIYQIPDDCLPKSGYVNIPGFIHYGVSQNVDLYRYGYFTIFSKNYYDESSQYKSLNGKLVCSSGYHMLGFGEYSLS